MGQVLGQKDRENSQFKELTILEYGKPNSVESF